jgi:hypothetical protein
MLAAAAGLDCAHRQVFAILVKVGIGFKRGKSISVG